MGYIKKLKNNELVGGTDKTTIYPVTSTKAVFEEVSENNFQSQEYLNNHITGDRIDKGTITDDNIAKGTITKGKLSSQVQTMLDEGQKKALTPKGNYNPEEVYEALDLVFDPATNSSYVSLVTPNTYPVDESAEGYEEGKWQKVMDGSYVNTAVAEIQTIIGEQLSQATAAVSDMKNDVDAAITQAQTDIQDLIEDSQQDLADATNNANGAAEQAMSVVANKVADAQIGYFECNTAANTSIKATTSDTIGTGTNASTFKVPATGASVKIKMKYANTADTDVKLQFGSNTATQKDLLYNGEAVSASNTWEEGEVISVYFDGSNYQAFNVQSVRLFDTSNIAIDDFVSGRYLKAINVGETAGIDAAVNCSYSKPVEVKVGDKVHCKHQGERIACICTTNATGSTYTAVAISSNNSGIVESTYIVEEDGYVAVSSRTVALEAWIIRKSEKYLPSNSVVSDMIEGSEAPISSGAVKSASDSLNSRIDEIVGAEITYDDTIWTKSEMYITTGGSTTSNSAWAVSKPIYLKKGWTITINSQGSSVCAIAQTDVNGTSYTPLVLMPSGVSGNNAYAYTASENIYIALSGKVSGNDVTVLLNIPSSLGEDNSNFDYAFEYVDGYYVKTDGNRDAASGTSYTRPKKVYVGDKIVMYSQGSGIAAISTSDESMSSITVVKNSTSTSGYIKHEYTVESEGYIVLSSRNIAFTEYPPYIVRNVIGLEQYVEKLSITNDVLQLGDVIDYGITLDTGLVALDGAITSRQATSPRHSQPIYIEDGNVIRVTTDMFYAIIIARTDANMSYLFPLRTSSLKVSDSSGGGVITYEYVVTNSGYYVFSIYAKTNNTIEIIPASDRLESTHSTSIIKRYEKSPIKNCVCTEPYTTANFKAFFFSDVHGGIDNLSRIIELAENYGNKVDCIINGGDTTPEKFTNLSNMSWFGNIINNCNVEILSAIGNHDTYSAPSSVDIYNAIVAPVATKYANIIQPSDAESSGKCYYYKDYNGIRVIILDANIGFGGWNTDEENWLISVLEDARTNDYHVICVNHCGQYQNGSGVNRYDSGFASKAIGSGLDGASNRVQNGALTAVQNFIDAGGTFVCWLFGHTHWDDFYTINNYPQQMCFVTTSARYNLEWLVTKSGNIRELDYDTFNYIGVFKSGKIIKLGRFGMNYNNWLEQKNGFVFDYGNHRLLTSS